MKEHITYIAEDGTEFRLKEDCLAYEAEKKMQFSHFLTNVEPYNEEGSFLNFSTEDEFIEIYEQMTFLIINDNLSNEETKFIEEKGYCPIPSKFGIYRYNNSAFEWEEFSETWLPMEHFIKEWYF